MRTDWRDAPAHKGITTWDQVFDILMGRMQRGDTTHDRWEWCWWILTDRKWLTGSRIP